MQGVNPDPSLECEDRSGWVKSLDVQWEEGLVGCDAGIGGQTRLGTGCGAWVDLGGFRIVCGK